MDAGDVLDIEQRDEEIVLKPIREKPDLVEKEGVMVYLIFPPSGPKSLDFPMNFAYIPLWQNFSCVFLPWRAFGVDNTPLVCPYNGE